MLSAPFLVILFRWLHVTTAAIAVGGVFYARIVLPIAAVGGTNVDDAGVRMLLRRARRTFKMVTHSCILFLLLSGTYNYVLNRGTYNGIGPLAHGLIGTHLLLGLAAMGLLLWLFIGADPRPSYLRWMAVTLGLMLATIAVASTLRYARDHRPSPSTANVPATTGPAWAGR